MIDKKKARLLKKLYTSGASYNHIAGEISESRKTVDNYIYRNGLSKGRKVGQRGGGGRRSGDGNGNGSNDTMSLAPVHRLKKDIINWLATHYCKKHGVPYLLHYGTCYLEEHPEMNRIGHFDLECSDLSADYSIILSYAILDDDGETLYGRKITKEELYSKDLDKHIVEDCIKDLLRFNIITTFFGTRFDFPLLRTRALMNKVPFPIYGTLKHIDMFYVGKSKLKTRRKSLERVCRAVLGTTRKTEIMPHTIPRCVQGNKEELDKLFLHNIYDVQDLRDLYHALIDYRYPNLKSI